MSLRKKQSIFEKLLVGFGFALLLLILSPLLLFLLLLFFGYRAAIYALVWVFWLPRGKDVLFVYSDSTIWRDYMLNEVLPLVQERAIVLNWSERNRWSKWSFSVRVFHVVGGASAFNPLLVMFRPFDTEVFRFWPAFKEWKKGNPAALNALMRELRMRR